MIQSYVFRETSVSGFPENFHAKKQYRLEVYKLANIKSAKKRILVIETKTLRNKMVKSKVKTLTKKVEAAVAAADKNAAATALKNAVVATRLLQRVSSTRIPQQGKFPDYRKP